jgi:hypothetical protein
MFENFLSLQNHFLENMFQPKIFNNILWQNIFLWLQQHFLEDGLAPKIFGYLLLKGKWSLHEGIFETHIYCEPYDHCRVVLRRELTAWQDTRDS